MCNFFACGENVGYDIMLLEQNINSFKKHRR